ncbi:fibroblast growth factor receptor substrate 2 [Caerostris extrusa]|uniref:Fibroblast growth factor receptor substrate 2 n=1 Tax=Caerostris extrusa TaxID=172846 RepID=A0AAV4P0D4_CAEEX|nr:fibroblast growth factor receptor substrate 2 [Caerostris extrusa]
MGCAFSKDYDTDPRIFNVWNVDGHGHPIKPGRIEVTGSELILYQKTNTVVKWPLISLRRYGFDTEVFSFECGRRCSTGAGVYAFRCNRAQELFAVLQESIINSTGTVCNNMTPEEQASAASHTSSDLVNSPHSASSVPNGHVPNLVTMSPLVDAFGYLQPNTGSNFIHFQPPIPVRSNSTAGSPGGYITFQDTNNPEGMTQEWPVMPASPPGCCSFGTCGGKLHLRFSFQSPLCK